MKEKVAYCQQICGEWFDDFVYTSIQPLKSKEFKIKPFETELELESYVFHEGDIIVGSVEATTKFFSEMGLNTPEYIGYPERIRNFIPYNGEELRVVKYSELDTLEYPYFIKPVKDVKAYTGAVIENDKQKEIFFFYGEPTPDTEFYINKPINIVSEYRCFFDSTKEYFNRLVGIKHYSGDFTKFPNNQDIFGSLISYLDDTKEKTPVTFTMDFGITDEGKTILIEINDMWAIGGYGLDGNTYTSLLIKRINEIQRENKN